jgi:hypothetical protein
LVALGGSGANKKPTAVSSRGLLSKFSSASTSANGVANYDDQQNDLSNISEHDAMKVSGRSREVKRRILAITQPSLRSEVIASPGENP